MRFLLTFMVLFSATAMAFPDIPVKSYALFTARTTTGYSKVIANRSPQASFQAYGTTSAGAGAATILIQVSDVPVPVEATDVDWITLGTITLTLGTTQTTDGFAKDAPWRHYRAKVSAISGTDASVNVYAGG